MKNFILKFCKSIFNPNKKNLALSMIVPFHLSGILLFSFARKCRSYFMQKDINK